MEKLESLVCEVRNDKNGRIIKVLYELIKILNKNDDFKTMKKEEKEELAYVFNDLIELNHFHLDYDFKKDRFLLLVSPKFGVLDIRIVN